MAAVKVVKSRDSSSDNSSSNDSNNDSKLGESFENSEPICQNCGIAITPSNFAGQALHIGRGSTYCDKLDLATRDILTSDQFN